MSCSTLSSQGLRYSRTCHIARQYVEANEFLNWRASCSHIVTENGISCLACCTFYLAVIWICLWITFKQRKKILQLGFYVDIRQTPVLTVPWKASLKPGVSCRGTCLCLHRWALQCQYLLALRQISREQLRPIPSSLWNAVAASKLPAGKAPGLVLTPNQCPGVSAACAGLPGPELCQGDGMGKAVPGSRCSPRHPSTQCTGVKGTQSSHRAGLCL